MTSDKLTLQEYAARFHDTDNSVLACYEIISGHGDEIAYPKLLIVSDMTPAVGILPILIGGRVLVEIHTTEFGDVASGVLKFPRDWSLGGILAGTPQEVPA